MSLRKIVLALLFPMGLALWAGAAPDSRFESDRARVESIFATVSEADGQLQRLEALLRIVDAAERDRIERIIDQVTGDARKIGLRFRVTALHYRGVELARSMATGSCIDDCRARADLYHADVAAFDVQVNEFIEHHNLKQVVADVRLRAALDKRIPEAVTKTDNMIARANGLAPKDSGSCAADLAKAIDYQGKAHLALDSRKLEKSLRLTLVARDQLAGCFREALDSVDLAAIRTRASARETAPNRPHPGNREERLQVKIEAARAIVEGSNSSEAMEVLEKAAEHLAKSKSLAGSGAADAEFDIAAKLMAKAVDLAQGSVGDRIDLKRAVARAQVLVDRAEARAVTDAEKAKAAQARDLIVRARSAPSTADALGMIDRADDLCLQVITSDHRPAAADRSRDGELDENE